MLTHEEHTVLEARARGKRIAAIARELEMSESTVKRLLARAYSRLGAASGFHAIRLATERGYFGQLTVDS
jgi:DNA-binding NarL/FixJ family response regulator